MSSENEMNTNWPCQTDKIYNTCKVIFNNNEYLIRTVLYKTLQESYRKSMNNFVNHKWFIAIANINMVS